MKENPHPALFSPALIRERVHIKNEKFKFATRKRLEITQGPGNGEKKTLLQFSFIFTDLTPVYGIQFYTGFINGKLFRLLFDPVSLKTSSLKDWDRNKKTLA